MQDIQTTKTDRLLRRALSANAAFSGLSGIALIVGFGPIGQLVGVHLPGLFIAIGVGLLLFALGLSQNARRTTIDRTQAVIATIADIAWVAASGAILLINPEPLTLAGKWLIAIVADVVALFAVLQLWGLRRWRDRPADASPE